VADEAPFIDCSLPVTAAIMLGRRFVRLKMLGRQ